MDDQFLNELRREPRPEFATALRRRLANADDAARIRVQSRRRFVRRALSFAAPIAAAIVALVAFPQVRTGAQAFLELFRVRNFVAVNVDAERLKSLQKDGSNPLTLLGEPTEITPREPAQGFDSPSMAFAAAGYAPHEPAVLPDQIRPDTAIVIGAQEGELRIEARKVNELLSSLGIHDITVPPTLDGARVGIRSSRAVAIAYESPRGNRVAHLVQAPHPEVSLPPGIERSQLAEIGLRIAGLPADEAHRFAERIDWNSTMLVPVPTGECTFREVEVKGRKALLIEAKPRANTSGDTEKRDGRVLLWSDDERIYALSGKLSDGDLLLMAGSLP